ncbi:MAG: hypothetical protein ACK517_01860, partial [bacterium]
PYEYFAEELPPQQPEANSIRSRLFVLPNLSVQPWSLVVFDEDGNSIDPSSVKIQNQTSAIPKFSCRLSFRLGAAQFGNFTKSLLVGNVHNTPSMSDLPLDLYTSRLLALVEGRDAVSESLKNRVIDDVKPKLERYSVETAGPQGVSASLFCGGKEIGTYSANATDYMANGSIIAIDCRDVDLRTAKLFYNGNFTLSCRMLIQASRVQSLVADVDLNRFYEAFSKELKTRETKATSSATGILFWRKVSRSVSTLVEESSNAFVESASRMNMNLVMRDVLDEGLINRATNFIFRDGGEVNEQQLRNLQARHLAAASESAASNPQLSEAHMKYAQMIEGMLTKSEDLDKRSEAALVSLGTLAGGANPYVAIASFLANGIILSNNDAGDRLRIYSARSIRWSESESRRFSASLAQQASLAYVIVQSDFPELKLRSKLSGREGLLESSSWEDLLRSELRKATEDKGRNENTNPPSQ